MTRFTSLHQLANCSPHVRAQLEKHMKDLPLEIPFNADTKPHKRERPEQEAGKLLVQWMDLLVLPNGLKPGEFFAHIPNGGARSAVEAGIFKGQGVRAGWPDYVLAIPRKQYHGLYGELKSVEGKKPDEEQLDVLARLESVGYKVCVWWGFDDAKRDISKYLDIA